MYSRNSRAARAAFSASVGSFTWLHRMPLTPTRQALNRVIRIASMIINIMSRLEGKVAVVTGGASGIGAAAVSALAREGAEVRILDIAAADACNVTDAGQTRAAMEQLPVIDILVNAAGIAVRHAVTEESEEAWDRCMAVNVKGIFLCSKYALPRMPAGG